MAKLIGLDSFGIPIVEADETGDKITRQAFLYLEPKSGQNEKDFAQCGSCALYSGSSCYLHAQDVQIKPDASCGFYCYGTPNPDYKGKELGAVTPDESELAEVLVQCHRCIYFHEDKSICGLYQELNQKFPDQFDLDENVKPHGCCNANIQKENK